MSEIKPLKFVSPYESQAWADREVRLMTITEGNVGFRDFMIPYGIDFQGLDKYRTKAAMMYLTKVSSTLMRKATLTPLERSIEN